MSRSRSNSEHRCGLSTSGRDSPSALLRGLTGEALSHRLALLLDDCNRTVLRADCGTRGVGRAAVA